MKKKIVIISSILLLISIGVYHIYGTLATDTSGSGEVFNFNISEGNTTVTVPAGDYKSVILKIKNINNGTVRYGIGYTNQSNIEVLAYNNGFDEMTGLIGKNEYKFIELRVVNKTSSEQSTTLTPILGYEHGGDLIVPSDKKLVSEEYTPPSSLQTVAETITNLYTNAQKTVVTNNSIQYNYANIYDTDSDDTTSGGLMDDRLGGTVTNVEGSTVILGGGNIRYYGANPNNYIYFNCDDYNNQSADTCELWRIIGVFKDRVKIIRNDSIGNLAWDMDKNIDSTLKTHDNNWETASLQVLLNQKYYNGDTAGTVTYYSATTSTTLNMSSIGIKNSATRNMIAEVRWNLGGRERTEIYSNEIYGYERGTEVYSGRPTEWPGKIALMYPSDYGYATDFAKCTENLGYYSNSSGCASNDWLFNSAKQWFLTPNSGGSGTVWNVDSSGYVYPYYSATTAYGVRPVLYLNSEQVIESGDGSSSQPFRLGA